MDSYNPENSGWMKIDEGPQLKELYDNVVEWFIKMVFILILLITGIFFGGAYLLRVIWAIHSQMLLDAEERNERYLQEDVYARFERSQLAGMMKTLDSARTVLSENSKIAIEFERQLEVDGAEDFVVDGLTLD